MTETWFTHLTTTSIHDLICHMEVTSQGSKSVQTCVFIFTEYTFKNRLLNILGTKKIFFLHGC